MLKGPRIYEYRIEIIRKEGKEIAAKEFETSE